MQEKISIPQEVYDRDYFLSDYLEGYDAFKEGGLSDVKAKQLDMLEISDGTALLEVGFGRGELLKHCADRGAIATGIDYADASIEVGKEYLKDYDIELQQADCRDLPFEDNTFDRVFSGDVIEHIDYEDGITMLQESYRVLKPGGFMIYHTTPNTVFMKITYPLGKPFLKMKSPEIISAIDDHIQIMRKVHVQEYNLITLRRVVSDAGLNGDVWLDSDILRSSNHRHTKELSKSPLIKFLGNVGNLGIVKFFFGNDLYLKIHKPE